MVSKRRPGLVLLQRGVPECYVLRELQIVSRLMDNPFLCKSQDNVTKQKGYFCTLVITAITIRNVVHGRSRHRRTKNDVIRKARLTLFHLFYDCPFLTLFCQLNNQRLSDSVPLRKKNVYTILKSVATNYFNSL